MSAGALTFMLIMWIGILTAVAVTLSSVLRHGKEK